MMFFLKDSMVGRKISGNLTAAKIGEISLQNVSKSPSPALLQTSSMKAGEILPGEGFSKDVSAADCQPLQKPINKRKRCRGVENETEKLMMFEKERIEIEKEKLQLLAKDNEIREREENDPDRLFLLSLLPLIRKVPERVKIDVKIKFQKLLQEALFSSSDNTNIYRPWDD